MSEIGYYRYKITPTTVGTVKLYLNGTLASTATYTAKEFCTNFRLLKYLDSSGRYRFFPFNEKWQSKDTPVSYGEITNFVTSILNSHDSAKQIGYKNTRLLSLTASIVSNDELNKLSDIYTSPRVYLYVGSGTTDLISDWVLVTVSGDGIGRRKNNNFSKVSIDVKLPEYYAVTKI